MKRSNVVRTLSRLFTRRDEAIVEDRGGCEKSALGAECGEEPEEREGAVCVNGRLVLSHPERNTSSLILLNFRWGIDSCGLHVQR